MSDETIMCPNCGRWVTFPAEMAVGACPACNWVRRRLPDVPSHGEFTLGIAVKSVLRALMFMVVAAVGLVGLLVTVLFVGCAIGR
jgi:hypothetical protein